MEVSLTRQTYVSNNSFTIVGSVLTLKNRDPITTTPYRLFDANSQLRLNFAYDSETTINSGGNSGSLYCDSPVLVGPNYTFNITSQFGVIPFGVGLVVSFYIVNNSAETISNTLLNLTDTTLSTPANAEVLTYNSTSGQWENAVAVGGGETNTSSSLGTGISVVNGKVASDLQFNSIKAGSTKISTTLIGGNEVTLDVVPASINMLDLGTKILNNLDDVLLTAVINNDILVNNGVGQWINEPKPIAGEVNTASSLGTGISVVNGKVASDIQLNSIKSGSTKISTTLIGGNEVTLDVVESNLVIANMSDSASYVTLTDTQSLSNKTIQNFNNTVAAKQLITGGSTNYVDFSGSPNPVSGQMVVATSSSTAEFQTVAIPTVLPDLNDVTFANDYIDISTTYALQNRWLPAGMTFGPFQWTDSINGNQLTKSYQPELNQTTLSNPTTTALAIGGPGWIMLDLAANLGSSWTAYFICTSVSNSAEGRIFSLVASDDPNNTLDHTNPKGMALCTECNSIVPPNTAFCTEYNNIPVNHYTPAIPYTTTGNNVFIYRSDGTNIRCYKNGVEHNVALNNPSLLLDAQWISLGGRSLIDGNPTTDNAVSLTVAEIGIIPSYLSDSAMLALSNTLVDHYVVDTDNSIKSGQSLQYNGTNWVNGLRSNLKNNLNPTSNDDETLGFSKGSRWLMGDDREKYECVDATTGAAVWKQIVLVDFGGGAFSPVVGDSLMRATVGPDTVWTNLTKIFGNAGFSNPGSPHIITIATQGTPVLINPVLSLNTDSFMFDVPQNGRLRCIDGFNWIVQITGTMSITNAISNNREFEWFLYKNGVSVGGGSVIGTTPNSGRYVSANGSTFIQMTNNDYIELYLQNNTNTDNFDITNMSLSAVALRLL